MVCVPEEDTEPLMVPCITASSIGVCVRVCRCLVTSDVSSSFTLVIVQTGDLVHGHVVQCLEEGRPSEVESGAAECRLMHRRTDNLRHDIHFLKGSKLYVIVPTCKFLPAHVALLCLAVFVGKWKCVCVDR